MDELTDMGVTVYGISPSSSQDHAYLKESAALDFELLSDVSLEFGDKLGFVDIDNQLVYRGYVAANLDTGILEKEVDYLVGQNVNHLLSILEDL